MDKKELRALCESLQDLFQCPVCTNSLFPTPSLCKNCHGICSNCKIKLLKCPLCDKEFIDLDRSTLLNQIFETIPKCCQFKGCKQLKISDDHMEFCEFRPATCKMICEWSGNVKDLITHVKTKHSKSCKVLSENESTANVQKKLSNLTEELTWYAPVWFGTEFFWVYFHTNVNSGYFNCSFYVIPTEKLKVSYYLVVSFKKGEIEFCTTCKAAINITDDNDLVKICAVGIEIPESEKSKFLDSEGRYCFTFKIVKEVH